MLYAIKNREVLGKIEELASPQNQAEKVRLEESLVIKITIRIQQKNSNHLLMLLKITYKKLL